MRLRLESLQCNPNSPHIRNDILLLALLRQPTEYTAVGDESAGHNLPEYRATHKRADAFMGLATSPEYATEVTLQPVDRYLLDAAILFFDTPTVPDAIGLGMYFVDGEGPKFKRPLRDEQAVMALQAPDLGALRYVFDAVTQISSNSMPACR